MFSVKGLMCVSLALIIVRISLAEVNPTDLLKDRWFSSITEKETPLWLCEGFTEGILYRLPKVRKCKLPNNPGNSTAINITVWWEDITHQEIEAHECLGLSSRVDCMWQLRGCSYTFFPDEKQAISIGECHAMIKDKVAPDGNPLKRIREGYWGTDNNTLPSGSMFYIDTEVRVNYYVRKLKIAISNVDQSVMTLAKVEDICHGEDGVCETAEGFLVWNPQKHHRCRMQEGETTTCAMTGSAISCPEISMSITDAVTRSICGNNISYSGEGIYFTLVETVEGFFDGVMTTTEAREKVKVGRSKRSETFMTTSEYNSRTEFIVEMITNRWNSDIQLLHYEMCKNAQSVTSNLRFHAGNGDPNMMIGSILLDDKYKARLHGDVVALWKCMEIRYDYIFFFVHYSVRFKSFKLIFTEFPIFLT
jgi:hypothetical protein